MPKKPEPKHLTVADLRKKSFSTKDLTRTPFSPRMLTGPRPELFTRPRATEFPETPHKLFGKGIKFHNEPITPIPRERLEKVLKDMEEPRATKFPERPKTLFEKHRFDEPIIPRGEPLRRKLTWDPAEFRDLLKPSKQLPKVLQDIKKGIAGKRIAQLKEQPKPKLPK